ncbi:MAG TPA: efflux RND transporter periplasmic adaptor subunit [Planctomycetes bacterium]|nr:efflux RND transporter periplasmic adaptor subunit [Planctomycetota bacterium]
MSRYVIGVVVILAALLAAAWLVSFAARQAREGFEASEPSGAIHVETAAVEHGVVEETAAFTATIRSTASVTVISKTQGRIVEKLFRRGDETTEGAVLYEIEKETALAAKNQAEAGQAAARAGLLQAQAGFSNAQREFERAKALFREGSITSQMLEKAEAGYQTAAGALAGAEAGLKSATAALALAAIAFNDTTIRSPMAGSVVQDFDLVIGDMAAPGAPVATILDTNRLKALIQLPERYLALVRKGTVVHIYPEGYPGVIHEKVAVVNPSVSELTRSAEVVVELEAPRDADGRPLVLPGQSCRVEVALSRQEGLKIPASAVVQRGGMYTVAVESGGVARVVPVRVSLITSAEAIVIEGLEAGQRVVSSGARLIKLDETGAGVKVTVINGR